jgi:hypothetical protein
MKNGELGELGEIELKDVLDYVVFDDEVSLKKYINNVNKSIENMLLDMYKEELNDKDK